MHCSSLEVLQTPQPALCISKRVHTVNFSNQLPTSLQHATAEQFHCNHLQSPLPPVSMMLECLCLNAYNSHEDPQSADHLCSWRQSSTLRTPLPPKHGAACSSCSCSAALYSCRCCILVQGTLMYQQEAQLVPSPWTIPQQAFHVLHLQSKRAMLGCRTSGGAHNITPKTTAGQPIWQRPDLATANHHSMA
jgi:hypothetical protein